MCFQFGSRAIDNNVSRSAKFLEFANEGDFSILGGIGDIESNQSIGTGDGARTVTKFQGVVNLSVARKTFP